jgi:membrane protease YdiL (CAAX protease family)
MLFFSKRDARASLIASVLIALAAWGASTALDLTWANRSSGINILADGLFGLALLIASDVSLHTMLSTLASERYTPTFLHLASLFAEQTPLDWLAGALAAGAEELLFRGVLVSGGIQFVGLGSIAAVALASAAFGLAHLTLERRLWGFSVWAAWEGMLLGLLYLASRSLVAVILARALHDLAAFWFFKRSLATRKTDSV